MADFTLRKTMTFVEDIHHENGPAPANPAVARQSLPSSRTRSRVSMPMSYKAPWTTLSR